VKHREESIPGGHAVTSTADEPAGNGFVPPPYGGTSTNWRRWAEELSISPVLGLRCLAIDETSATIELQRSPWPLHPRGEVHGGLVAAICDHCIAVVSVRSGPAGRLPATTMLVTEYHRPAYPPLTFHARIKHRGATILFAEVVVTNRDGVQCAAATATLATSDGLARLLNLPTAALEQPRTDRGS
jgi:uncharacterized protein (TIGR00369 family)